MSINVRAALRRLIPPTGEPAAPVDGELWTDTAAGRLKRRVGGAWRGVSEDGHTHALPAHDHDMGDLPAAAAALAAYPVGAIYLSVVNTSPATLFGGEWATLGAGRVLVGVDTGQAEFDTVEKTGGSKTHTLTIGELPDHDHPTDNGGNFLVDGEGGAGASALGGAGYKLLSTTGNRGGGGAHNNLQPYLTCFMWKRTA